MLDVNTIKNKILTSANLSESEKREWLFLLPKMSAEQLEELDQIISINIPIAQKPATPVSPPVKPAHPTTPIVPKNPITPITKIAPKPAATPPVKPYIKPQPVAKPAPIVPAKPVSPLPSSAELLREESAARKSTNPDLLKIQHLSLPDLRKETSPYNYLEKIMDEIKNLIQMRRVNVNQVEEVLEQSPLYKIYLQEGINRLAGQAGTLSQEEFECLTDFRHALKKLG